MSNVSAAHPPIAAACVGSLLRMQLLPSSSATPAAAAGSARAGDPASAASAAASAAGTVASAITALSALALSNAELPARLVALHQLSSVAVIYPRELLHHALLPVLRSGKSPPATPGDECRDLLHY